MKKHLFFLVTTSLTFGLNAQTVNYGILEQNNANPIVNDGGVFFNNYGTSNPGYTIPENSNLNTFYSVGFWYAGTDINNQLKLSAQQYTVFEDQFKGPLTIGTALPSTNGTWSNALFVITKAQILDHIANYNSPGYVTPSAIDLWPAHGDVALGFDSYLAPFYDYNMDGFYEPSTGDYPCIRGDKAIYIIMNDKGGVHGSGGDPIGIEMHYMFYEINSNDDLNNTTFIHGKVINRGTQTINDFKMSMFMDGDIGNYSDDYFGSDSTRNLAYFYNGDNLDEDNGGAAGYQSSPPAAGVMSLTHDFESIGMITGNVSSPFAIWNLMNAMDEFGVYWTNSTNSSPTNFMYGSDPTSSVELDSEAGQNNPPGDRRGLATINMGTLGPSDVREFDYAVIYNRAGNDNLDNASGLAGVADFIQNYFDSNLQDDCATGSIGLPENKEAAFEMYPNPAHDKLTISIPLDHSFANIRILDLSGRVVLDEIKLTESVQDIEIHAPCGVYIVNVNIDGRDVQKRIIIQ